MFFLKFQSDCCRQRVISSVHQRIKIILVALFVWRALDADNKKPVMPSGVWITVGMTQDN